MCQWHYKLQLRGEDLRPIRDYLPRTTNDDDALFWATVDQGASDACWPWRGSMSTSGYGLFRRKFAHRIAYERTHGAIRPGMQVDHQCRNRECCNPAHLKQVTAGENRENIDVQANNSSGARGVSWDKRTGRWAAYTHHRGKRIWGGRHLTFQAAEAAARELRNKLHTNNVLDRR